MEINRPFYIGGDPDDLVVPGRTLCRFFPDGDLYGNIVRKEGRLMQDVITIIQTVGFPIACAIAMFIMLKNETQAHKEESEKLTATINDMKLSFNDAIHAQEDSITEAINNNTLVIQKLLDKLEKE